jgi:hypothetical protein
MLIIENLQKISDTVWELPSTYTDAVRSNRGRGFDDGARLRASTGPAHGRLQTALEPDATISEALRRAYLPVIAWGTFSVRFDASGERLKSKRSSQPGTIRSMRRTWRSQSGVHYGGAYQI